MQRMKDNIICNCKWCSNPQDLFINKLVETIINNKKSVVIIVLFLVYWFLYLKQYFFKF
jgi:hypothetical protein